MACDARSAFHFRSWVSTSHMASELWAKIKLATIVEATERRLLAAEGENQEMLSRTATPRVFGVG